VSRAEGIPVVHGGEDVNSMRYRTESEQLRAEVAVYERGHSLGRQAAGGPARLNLDERAVKLQEAQVALPGGALAEAGLAPGLRQQITVRVAELVARSGGTGAAALSAGPEHG
jgi:hypothetical protein